MRLKGDRYGRMDRQMGKIIEATDTLPIVVNTVEEKNTAWATLHFLKITGKLSVAFSLRPPSTALCAA